MASETWSQILSDENINEQKRRESDSQHTRVTFTDRLGGEQEVPGGEGGVDSMSVGGHCGEGIRKGMGTKEGGLQNDLQIFNFNFISV